MRPKCKFCGGDVRPENGVELGEDSYHSSFYGGLECTRVLLARIKELEVAQVKIRDDFVEILRDRDKARKQLTGRLEECERFIAQHGPCLSQSEREDVVF